MGETGSYFMETMFSGFLSDVPQLCCLNPLWFTEFPDEQMASLVAEVKADSG